MAVRPWRAREILLRRRIIIFGLLVELMKIDWRLWNGIEFQSHLFPIRSRDERVLQRCSPR
jgi:hypothetical protein